MQRNSVKKCREQSWWGKRERIEKVEVEKLGSGGREKETDRREKVVKEGEYGV